MIVAWRGDPGREVPALVGELANTPADIAELVEEFARLGCAERIALDPLMPLASAVWNYTGSPR
jgi:hypothetical protein